MGKKYKKKILLHPFPFFLRRWSRSFHLGSGKFKKSKSRIATISSWSTGGLSSWISKWYTLWILVVSLSFLTLSLSIPLSLLSHSFLTNWILLCLHPSSCFCVRSFSFQLSEAQLTQENKEISSPRQGPGSSQGSPDQRTSKVNYKTISYYCLQHNVT